MEVLFVLLKNYQSAGEAFVVGALSGLFLYAVVAISRGIINAKQRNKKDFDEVSKKETNMSSTSDWDEIKKEDN